jgi:hypothetical protein
VIGIWGILERPKEGGCRQGSATRKVGGQCLEQGHKGGRARAEGCENTALWAMHHLVVGWEKNSRDR